MHTLQHKLLQLAAERNLGEMSLRDIGKLIHEDHPQKIKHHLSQLESKGLIKRTGQGKIVNQLSQISGLLSIPIVGSANCGPANIYADERIEGYLKVSSKLLPARKKLFALKTVGNSLNRASIKGKNIEDGDYVLVDSQEKQPKNKDYVVSIIDGVCNIKRYIEDRVHKRIALISESTDDFPPIIIDPTEVNYLISGKVIDVIKPPKV